MDNNKGVCVFEPENASDRYAVYEEVVAALDTQSCDFAIVVMPRRPIVIATMYLSELAGKSRGKIQTALSDAIVKLDIANVVEYRPPIVFPSVRHTVELYHSLVFTFYTSLSVEELGNTARKAVQDILLRQD